MFDFIFGRSAPEKVNEPTFSCPEDMLAKETEEEVRTTDWELHYRCKTKGCGFIHTHYPNFLICPKCAGTQKDPIALRDNCTYKVYAKWSPYAQNWFLQEEQLSCNTEEKKVK